MDTTHQLFPVCRYFDCGKSGFYYPYGNTPAEDFLENVHPNSVKKPDILVLGCGDIRSCFYTLWKHFSLTRDTKDAASSFSGVHFVLNDHSAAVLARNVIFLYLCLQKPSAVHSTEFNHWLSALWAIWFSKNLHPDHKKVLDSALRDLLHCSTDTKSWASKENQLNSFVQFSSECTLSKIHDVWNMWLTHPFNKERDNKKMHHITISTSVKTDIENLNGMAVTTGLSSSIREKMELEISGCSSGNTFAEYVVSNGQVLPVMKLVANVTMYDRTEADDNYTMDSSIPFRCFHHAFRFTPSQLKSSCTATLLNQLIVSDETFQEYPLLANSVQQLALWLSCTSILTPNTSAAQQEACIKFTFNCSDAIQFCNELQNGLYESKLKTERFDVVYTSNLLDHLHPPNIVLFAMPLLKAEGYLFTTTMKYKLLAKSTHDYIAQSFGIDNKMLPMLFGIRCINHEGDEYRSQVSIKPVPVETNAIFPEFTPYYAKVLIWEKLPSIIIQDISPDSNLWRALYSSISTVLSIPLQMFNTSSSQTAVKMLQTFLAHVNGDNTDSKFWDPFCSLLKTNDTCKHLLLALQTHSILSGVHLHLLVTDKTCPICNKVPMSNYFSQISLSIQPQTQFQNVQLYAQVYKSAEQFSTFDCLASQNDLTYLKLCFIIPLHLCESDHYVSIVSYSDGHAPQVLKDGPLKSFLTSKLTYSFSKPKPSHRKSDVISTTLGCLKSHYGDGDIFKSIIALSEDGYSMYSSSKKIHPEELSPSEIRLSCGVHKFDLSYPHPINFSNLSIKISRSRKTLTIEASRKTYEFHDEEAPLFLVYPDCRVTLPQLNVHDIVLRCLMGMQCSSFEVSQLRSRLPCSPLTDLKNTINIMMQTKDETYFAFADSKNSLFGMVMVINRAFDYQVKAPAIDLIYRVTTEESVMRKWMRFTSNPSVMEIMRSTIELMDKVFLYFSKRTISSSPLKPIMKVKKKVDGCFKRAVVYPLYSDPDDNVRNQQVTWNEIKSNPINSKEVEEVERISCTFCGHISVGIFTCEKCLTVKFCGKCKRQHFSEHEVSCNAKKSDTVKPLSSATLSSSPQPAAATKCNFCFKQSSKLKKCSNCHSVQYCSQECQVKHWKEHKTDCRSKIDQPSSDSQNDSVLELSSSDLNKCALCHQTSPILKACSNCLSVKYCSKECQRKHWSEHKMVCKQQSEVLNESTACSYCSKVSSSLKKCTLCHAAQYCDKECQTKHWKIHKLQCKSEPVDLSTSPSKSADAELEHESQKCSFCSRQAKELKKCTRCNNTQYCDRTCQQKHWASHKNTCKPVSS